MADTTLFSTNVIVRNVGGRKLKVADTEQIQSMTKSHLVDRYSKLHSGLDLVNSGYSTFAQLQAARLGLFKDYESMEADSIIASALDIYADECTMKNPYGQVLEIQSDNDNIKQILHNLFYDIMNIEFNLWPWTRNLVKYGDFFLYLDVEDKYGITNVVPISPYELVRSEGEDPETILISPPVIVRMWNILIMLNSIWKRLKKIILILLVQQRVKRLSLKTSKSHTSDWRVIVI